MKISVRVVPNAKMEKNQENVDGSLKVWLKSKPVDGRANEELIEALAKYYKVKKNDIMILKGHTSRNKVVEICCKEDK